MWRVIKFLLTGDWHLCEWETVNSNNVTNSSGTKVIGNYYDCRCKHCGRIKEFRT